jgi:hypothetical protein
VTTSSPDRETVARLMRDAAETDPDSGRVTVHSLLGGIGADWDLDDALALVKQARAVSWLPHPLAPGHGLCVLAEDAQVSAVLRDVGLNSVGELTYWFAVPVPPQDD